MSTPRLVAQGLDYQEWNFWGTNVAWMFEANNFIYVAVPPVWKSLSFTSSRHICVGEMFLCQLEALH